MRHRKEILFDIIHLKGNLQYLQSELSAYPWDSDRPEIIVNSNVVVNILNLVINHELEYSKLIEWANIIEFRDDVDFASEYIKEIIHYIANPELNGYLTDYAIKDIIEKIKLDNF